MARRPNLDERLVLKPRSDERDERVWVGELARFLFVKRSRVMAFARKHDYLRHLPMQSRSGQTWYVSPHAARLIILHFRNIQGEGVLTGLRKRDPFVQRDQDHADMARKKARALRNVNSGLAP